SLPWLSVIGVSSSAITLSTVYRLLRVGVTALMPSGIWMASSVVAEPSHPCGTLKVRISYAPASTVSSAKLPCAWAVTAPLSTRPAAPNRAPTPASRGRLVRRVLMVSLFLLGADPAVWSSSGNQRSWVVSVRLGRPALFSPCENRACGAPSGRRTWTCSWLSAALAVPTPPTTRSSIIGPVPRGADRPVDGSSSENHSVRDFLTQEWFTQRFLHWSSCRRTGTT